MPKATLYKTWLYNGKFYGPGVDVDLPDDAHTALKAKGAFEAPVTEEPAQPTQEESAATIEGPTHEERAAALAKERKAARSGDKE